MFVLDEFGNWVFVPRGLCSAEGDDAAGGGGDQGADKAGDADAGADKGQDGGDKQQADKGADDGADKAAADKEGGDDAPGADKAKAEQTPDWRAGITDDKERTFAERFDSPAALAREALKLRQKTSAAIIKPGKNATHEEVAAYRKAMGVPTDKGGYEISIPDDLPEHLKPSKDGAESLDAFREMAHESGLSQAQFEAATEWYFKTVAAQETAFEKKMEVARERAEAKLRKEMGPEYDASRASAVRAAEHFGGDQFKQMIETVTLDGVRLGDHPTFIRTFAPIGRLLKEADPLSGMSEDAKDDLEKQHSDATKAIHEAHDRGDRAEVDRLQKKRSQISEKIAGRAPAMRGI